MAQVMRKHFRWRYSCSYTKCFHLGPDLPPRYSLSAFGEKDLTGSDFLFFSIFQQLPAELSRDQNGADFSFQRDLRTPSFDSLHRQIFYFGDTYSCGADAFNQKSQTFLTKSLRCLQQSNVFFLCEFPFRIPKHPVLKL